MDHLGAKTISDMSRQLGQQSIIAEALNFWFLTHLTQAGELVAKGEWGDLTDSKSIQDIRL